MYSGPEVLLEEVSPDRYWETPICPGIRNEVVPERSATLTLRLFQGCPSLGRNPRLDHQTDPGLTGAHGLIATIPEPNAENRGAVCSQSRRSLPSADGQTEDTRHEEQREQLAAPTIPPGGIFCRR